MLAKETNLRVATDGLVLLSIRIIARRRLTLATDKKGHELQLEHNVVVSFRMRGRWLESERMVKTTNVCQGVRALKGKLVANVFGLIRRTAARNEETKRAFVCCV